MMNDFQEKVLAQLDDLKTQVAELKTEHVSMLERLLTARDEYIRKNINDWLSDRDHAALKRVEELFAERDGKDDWLKTGEEPPCE